MPKRNPLSVHTTPNKDGSGWTNVVNGRVTSTHRTQAAAAETGRARARAIGAEHRIHGRNGQIRESNSYGSDPHPPRG